MASPSIPLYQKSAVPYAVQESFPAAALTPDSFPQWLENAGKLSHVEQRIASLALRLLKTSEFRYLHPAALARWKDNGMHLQLAFPHFAEVTELIGDAVYLSHLSGTQIRIPPLLLLGDPGIGKTHYLRYIATLLGLEFRALSMASLTAGFVLSGMNPGWADAKAGMVFQQLVFGETANPVLLLDEIDKIGGDAQHDPYGPLYDLLEPHSARSFRDEYFPLPINASQIQWVATANEVGAIPEPIRSRMRVIDVPKPTREQRGMLARILYFRLQQEACWGNAFRSDLPPEVSEALAAQAETPREIRKALEEACARAARECVQNDLPGKEKSGRLRLRLDHLPQRVPATPFGFAPPPQKPAPPPRRPVVRFGGNRRR